MTRLPAAREIDAAVEHLFVSTSHKYFGRHNQEAAAIPIIEVESIDCVAGQGIIGDRFFGFKPDYRGQITFYSEEVFSDLITALGVSERKPGSLRRNVGLRGLDLNTLIGQRFSLQGVVFEGTVECSPCHWMDQAVGPGARDFLVGRGGLRARILSSGTVWRSKP